MREEQLRREPLCRFHRERGKIVPATVVDHILSIEQRPDLRLELSNLRSLCKECHDRHTASAQGFNLGKRGSARPDWLRPASIPVVLVCGPPASGKSTYVAEHASQRDLVVDLDEIAAQLSGEQKHSWSRRKWLHPALRARNALLGRLSEPRPPWPRAWVIVSEPRSDNRQWWVDELRPERIVVLETKPETCMARARMGHERARDITQDAIIWWWSQYQRRAGDEVVRE